MTEHVSGHPDAGDRFVHLDDGDMHLVTDGRADAPVLLLIHGLAASTAGWEPVVPSLAGAYRVIRVDLLGHGRSTVPSGGYDIPTQARRVGAALDRLGAGRVTVIGHSTGGAVATALAEQQPDAVAALALIDTGPSLDARIPQNLLSRLLLTRVPGRLLWRLRTEATVRKAFRTAVTRLAALGVPVLVIFGADDQRWRSSSVAAYRVVPGARVELLPGVGHSPMLENPETTGKLLLDFAATAGNPH